MREHHLRTPLQEEELKALQLGDLVYITGTLWTARSKFHIRVIDEGQVPPFDVAQHNAMLHSGPVVERLQEGWRVKWISVTWSQRFERWAPELIRRLPLKAILGKASMGQGTAQAMRERCCVYLSKVGQFSGALAERVLGVREVHWLDLGLPEATWILEVKDFGPFLVAIDSKGGSLYGRVHSDLEERRQRIYELLGIEDFKYASGTPNPL